MGRFRRGFRRKRRGTWLPNVGSIYSTTTTVGEQCSYIQFIVQPAHVGPNAGGTVFSAAMQIDSPDPALTSGSAALGQYQLGTLAQEESFGYMLNRIVGTFVVAIAKPAVIEAGHFVPTLCVVTCGFMVRRIDQEDVETPVVGAQGSDPQSIENIQDPWLWRRSWLLTTNSGGAGLAPDDHAANFGAGDFVSSNSFGTGSYNTCNVDVKSRRRITKEERLFLSIGVRTFGFLPDSTSNLDVDVLGFFDYRSYGSIITTQGNRRNAVR